MPAHLALGSLRAFPQVPNSYNCILSVDGSRLIFLTEKMLSLQIHSYTQLEVHTGLDFQGLGLLSTSPSFSIHHGI